MYTKILLAIIFLLFTFDASAMECSPTPIDHLFKQSDFVFEAEVVKRKPVRALEGALCSKYSKGEPTCGPKIADLKIKEIWKGSRDETPSLYSGDACYCLGSYLSEGETYVIFAKRAEPQKPYRLIATPGCGSIRLEKYSNKEKLKIKKFADRP
jgi:hypothetical protein